MTSAEVQGRTLPQQAQAGHLQAVSALSHSAVTEACRLCGGPLLLQFSARVLSKHTVRYFKCTTCQSLQTETPYWLDEAYGKNLSSLDTGAAQRNLRNLAAGYSVARVFGAQNLLDKGGGDGLLCRLLRDTGLNCFVQDRYAQPTYAQGFDTPDFQAPDMITAFEVFEHLPCPAHDLKEFFEGQPRLVLISTEIYSGQEQDWWYISPESGQHVFFYSQKAMQQVAAQFGYRFVISGEFTLFVRRDVDSAWRRSLAALLLKRKVCKLVAARLMLRSTPGIAADFDLRRRAADGAVATGVAENPYAPKY